MEILLPFLALLPLLLGPSPGLPSWRAGSVGVGPGPAPGMSDSPPGEDHRGLTPCGTGTECPIVQHSREQPKDWMGPQLALTASWISHRGTVRRALPSLWGCERLKDRVDEEKAGEGRGSQNKPRNYAAFQTALSVGL